MVKELNGYNQLFGNETPSVMNEGVIMIQGTPHYIVERLESPSGIGDDFVTVYEAKGDSKNPVKAYTYKETEVFYSAETFLGKLANKLNPPKKDKRKVTNRPIFTAEVEYGIDTFTKAEGLGFYERTKMKPVVKDGHYIVEGGKKTGVFISLDSIKWLRKYVATDEIIKTNKATKMVFYI